METSYLIGSTIKALRRQRDISQEVLATALDVSIQAVSKWETGASFPDILLLPRIAQFFGVTIDSLFFGEQQPEAPDGISNSIPDDGVLRVVQFLGRRCLSREVWRQGQHIPLNVEHLSPQQVWNVEIWGSAEIKGNVGGDVNAGDGVNCGSVGGDVNPGDGVNCGPVGGDVNAGDGVNCGPVGGSVHAGGSVTCGDIGGHVEAGENIECNEIRHAGHIRCKTLLCPKGHIHCDGMELKQP